MLTSVSLICNPARPALDAAVISRARAAAHSAGLVRGDLEILSEGVAAELVCIGSADGRSAAAAIEGALRPAPVDVVVQPAEGRRKRFLIADMDSTIIGQECIDELADSVGLRAEISAITERAMRGEIDFEGALLQRVAMLKGMPESVLSEVFGARIALNPGARTLVQTMKKAGAATALVSGGFSYFVERVAALAGFGETRANRLEIESGVLTGEVARPILGRMAKLEALRSIAEANGIGQRDTLAVGDGANDLDMLSAAGLGVAYRAKPSVASSARVRIDHGDLTALLFVQGYRLREFVD